MNLRTTFIRSSGFRRRIWDIYNGYHCAIIGTCLRRVELRKIAKKKIFALDTQTSDYHLHSSLVTLAAENSPRAKALHTLLDTKYQAAVSRYSRVKTDEAEALWEIDLARGAIAGAFWAIATHLGASQELVHRIYGQIHMLGHDFLTDHQQNLRQIHELHDKNSIYQEILVSERQHHLRQKRELEEELASLRLAQKEHSLLIKENEQLVKERTTLQSAILEDNGIEVINRLNNEITSLRQYSAIQCGRIDTLSDELRQARSIISKLKGTNTQLSKEKAEQGQEILSIEAALISKITSAGCAGCADQETDRCPGPDLCGKKILYVGGLKKMVPHYQQLVENYGGRFMHHDGGIEVSRNQLPKMLGNADIVFCPVDCVSHDACTCVKKMCKHYQKPFVMMRSSGLSSLAKELSNIIQ